MRTETGTLSGPISITEDLDLKGMITGGASVSAGARLELHGMVAGDLLVEAGSHCELRGTVTGSLMSQGSTNVYGTVVGRVAGSGLVVHPGSMVAGTVH